MLNCVRFSQYLLKRYPSQAIGEHDDEFKRSIRADRGIFRGLGVPDTIVHWGHPAMMGIVVLVLGSYVAWSGWQGRLAADKEATVNARLDHRKAAPLMTLFITLGYTGGVLSLVMQHKPILESPHFWTGNVVLALLFLKLAVGSLSLD